MDFVAVVDQVIALLRQQGGRMTYRTLKRQFALDDTVDGGCAPLRRHRDQVMGGGIMDEHSCDIRECRREGMIIVSGRTYVRLGARQDFLTSSAEAVAQARRAPGCRDFVVAASPIEPDRVNIYRSN